LLELSVERVYKKKFRNKIEDYVTVSRT